MHRVEVWHWAYRDPLSGMDCTSRVPLSAAEATAQWPDAQPVAGSMRWQERLDPEELFQETAAAAFYQSPR